MNDDHIDFGSLDPLRDPERVERALRKIARRAAPLLAARRTPRTAFQQVARWRRPMLAAAAVITIASVSALLRFGGSSAESAPPTVAEVVGVPSTLAGWVRSDSLPTPGEIVVSLETTQ